MWLAGQSSSGTATKSWKVLSLQSVTDAMLQPRFVAVTWQSLAISAAWFAETENLAQMETALRSEPW